MSLPDVRLLVDFGVQGLGSFTIGDSTLGVLNGPGLLGNTGSETYSGWWTVIPDMQDMSTRRGRTRILETVEAGRLDTVLVNRERKYDPTYSGSPLFGGVLPRKAVKLWVNDVEQWTGEIEDWDLSFQPSGVSLASLKAADAFVQLSRAELKNESFGVETTGVRIGNVLDAVGWSGGTALIDAGETQLVAGSATTNALGYAQSIAQIEPGVFFIDKSGDVRFRSRDFDAQLSGLTFADDGTGVPFSNIEVEYGTESMINDSLVTDTADNSYTAQNATSVGDYGLLSYTVNDAPFNSAIDAQSYAGWFVEKYAQPQLRIKQVRVPLQALSTDQVTDVLGLELGDVVTIKFTPNSIGSAIEQLAVVDAISHQAILDDYIMTFDVSQTSFAFILEDDDFGILDQNILGY